MLHADGEGAVEIDTFGLVPEHVGHGYGGYALTLATETAWAFAPDGTTVVQRVWLDTSSNDHPHALRNYQSRGFRVFHSERRGHKSD